MARDLISRILGRTEFGPPASNGAKAAEPPAQKAEPTLTGFDFAGPTSANLAWLLGGIPGDVQEVTRQTAFAASAYVYAAIQWRAKNLSEPPLLVWEVTDDGDERLLDHELAELLEEPSPDLDMGGHLYLTHAWRDLFGAALWVVDDNLAGRPARVVAFAGDEFTVHTDPSTGRIFGEFRVQTRAGPKVFRPGPDEDRLVYLPYLNPGDRHRGLAPTDVALSWLNLGVTVKATVKNFLKKAMFPGGAYVLPKDFRFQDEDEKRQMQQDLATHHGGPGNAGEPLLIWGGGDYKQTALPLDKLIPSEVLDRVEAVVSSVFGVPPVVLSWMVGLENSPWSQMEEARRMAYEDTLLPLWNDYGKQLTRQLLRPIDDDRSHKIRFDLTDVVALQPDMKVQSEISQANRDVLKVNERRILLGHEPLPDDDERGEDIPGLREETSPVTINAGTPPSEAKAQTSKDFDADIQWLEFDVSTKAQEPVWEREVLAELKGQRSEVLKIADEVFGDLDQEVTAAEAAEFLERASEYLEGPALESLATRLEPLIASTGEQAVRRVAGRLRLDFSVLQPHLAEYVPTRRDFLVEAMGETTGEAVAGRVEKAVGEGQLIRDLRKELEELPEFDRTRAQLTARTETTAVTNGAQRESLSGYNAETEGVRVEKSWLSSRDARVRDEHAAEDDGSWIGIDETYPETGRLEPGDPNCRCSQRYRIVEE